MKRLLPVILLLSAMLALPAVSAAQAAAASTGGPTDPKELEAFIDGIMAEQLQADNVAGAVVAVVKDGRLFFAKGYGWADIKNGKPVRSDLTMFRPGSISKLFVWTAVMQLYEQGRIDLDADVNTYLKGVRIPATFPQPVTMKHLMSHSAGFEEKGVGMGAKRAADLMPLGRFLAEFMPGRVRPPGEYTAYSNYGTALAGYIVECISGMPFEEYVERNIFGPLGMAHSTFREPLPPALAPDMSVGYSYEKGVFKAHDFELINGMIPAGSLSATAEDMARFMIAHLQNGLYGDSRILKDETARFMHQRLFGHDPRVAGNAHGFWEADYNGLHLIEHGGDLTYFHAQLALIPDKNLGWFVAYNSPNGKARRELFRAFLDRYYPAPKPAPIASAAVKPETFKRLAAISGYYFSNRMNFTTFEKLSALGETRKLSAAKDGHLLISSSGGVEQYEEIEPYVFRKIGGENRIVFKAEGGRVKYAFLDVSPHAVLYKVPWYQAGPFNYSLMAFSFALFLSAVLGWPLAALVRVIRRRKDGARGGRAPKAARWLAGIMSGLFIVALMCLLMAVLNGNELMFGVNGPVKAALVLPYAAMAAGLAALYFAGRAWMKGYWTPAGRIHYTLVVAAGLTWVWFLSFWKLIGL